MSTSQLSPKAAVALPAPEASFFLSSYMLYILKNLYLLFLAGLGLGCCMWDLR